MHLAYAWLSAALALLGISRISSAVPEIAALHALGGGAIGTMIAAVMTRATLAYSGGSQQVGAMISAALASLQVAAILRVAAALRPDAQMLLLGTSGAAWIMAFIAFSLCLGPRLCEIRRKSGQI
jgi:uncharacterized protein involved in response to NO